MEVRSGKTEGNICRKGRTCRMANVNLLQTRQNRKRSRPEATEGLVNDSRQHRKADDVSGAWHEVRRLILLSYYLSSFINIDHVTRRYFGIERKSVGREKKLE